MEQRILESEKLTMLSSKKRYEIRLAYCEFA